MHVLADVAVDEVGQFLEVFGSPPIMRRGGAQGPPTFTVLDRNVDFPA